MDMTKSATVEGRAARYLALADKEIEYHEKVKKLVARVLEVHERLSMEPDGPRSNEFDKAICLDYGLVAQTCAKYLMKWDS